MAASMPEGFEWRFAHKPRFESLKSGGDGKLADHLRNTRFTVNGVSRRLGKEDFVPVRFSSCDEAPCGVGGESETVGKDFIRWSPPDGCTHDAGVNGA